MHNEYDICDLYHILIMNIWYNIIRKILFSFMCKFKKREFTMKRYRYNKIKEIVQSKAIETQEELAAALLEEGIEVTQATVSRDIKELMLIKIPTGDGHYRYALSPEENVVLSRSRINRLFQDSLIKVDHSLNQVVLHTIPGSAQSVAFSIDHAKWTEIIGTLAGDDTILLIAKSEAEVPAILAKIQDLMKD